MPNGLSMCKIHHAAFDAHVLGIRPDLLVEIREDVLRKIDGPTPRRAVDHPDKLRLEQRYEAFRSAS